MQVTHLQLHKTRQLRCMLVKDGKHRRTLVFKCFVIKIPRNKEGFCANWQEFCISIKDRKHYARVYLFLGVIVAEKVSPLDFMKVNRYLRYGKLSDDYTHLKQALDEIKPYCTESYQIGVDRKGRLKYYDYEYGNTFN